MNYDEVTSIISNIINIKEDYEVFFWVGTDGIFHNTENPNPRDELICCCGISFSTETGDWIVTPWLYNIDIPGIYKSAYNARAMAFFWLNWMTNLYGDGTEEPSFEADWLSVKSNRSTVLLRKECGKMENLSENEKQRFINHDPHELAIRYLSEGSCVLVWFVVKFFFAISAPLRDVFWR